MLIGLFVVFALSYLERIIYPRTYATRTELFRDSDIMNQANFSYLYAREIIMLPALAMHLWLPLLALGVMLGQAVSYFGAAANWTQWFIKQGRNHPFDAVGYVAAVILFVGAALFQWVLPRFVGN
jgi:hypothetical protein